MIDLLVSWVWYPLLLLALCGGVGLLLARAAGRAAGALTVPLGFAGTVVVTQASTAVPALARWSAPLLVAIAAAGYAAAWLAGGRPGTTWRRLDRPAALAGVAAFTAYAAPVVLAGSATFTGWIKLDDTATWLAFADRLATAGRTTAGLAPSTYEAVLQINWDGGYPVGAFAPLGVTGLLGGADVAWLFQPYLAFLAALVALTVATLLARVVDVAWWRGVAAAISAGAALLYGYALWGGLKELALVTGVALAAAAVPAATGLDAGWRDAVAPAVAAAAVVGVMGPSGAAWLLPVLLGAAVLLVRRRGWRTAAAGVVMWGALAAVAAVPTLALARPDVIRGGVEFVGGSGDIGNLVGPLRFAQIAGIWPTGDFRYEPFDLGPTYLLVAVTALAAVVGIVVCLQRRAVELPLFVAATVLPAIGFGFGNAWVAGKALAVASPAVLAAAAVAAAWLLTHRQVVAGGVLAGLLVVGVLWSDVAQYHDAWLAPRGPLAELETIGREYAGRGPALMTEYSTFGARHFLRDLDAESASELRRRVVPLRSGETLGKGGYADVDAFALESLLDYPTLVLRRSATASRPPSAYRLDWTGRYYEVWVSDPAAPAIVEHLPLGTATDPVAVPACADVRRLAAAAGPDGQVAAVPRAPNVTMPLTGLPSPWPADPSAPGAVVVDGPGSVTGSVTVTQAGEYGLWLQGSFRSWLTVTVDDVEVYRGRHQLPWPGTSTPVGTASLAAGEHRVTVTVGGGDLLPGSGGPATSLGPLVLSQSTAATPVAYTSSAQAAARFCGRSLDWVEAVR